MPEPTFSPGDRVRHIKGGSVGTVEEIYDGAASGQRWIFWCVDPRSEALRRDFPDGIRVGSRPEELERA